jgi:hypothetical protein
MPDRVHAPMDPVQTPSPHTPGHRREPKPKLTELSHGDEPMLSSRHGCQRCVTKLRSW